MCHSQHGDLYKSGQTGKAWQQIMIILIKTRRDSTSRTKKKGEIRKIICELRWVVNLIKNKKIKT